MPVTGTVDLSSILPNLGDPHHGLRAAGPAENTEKQNEDYPYRATQGPVDMSTSMALEPAWDLIWDVNGYYRALGIGWPYRPTKGELRLAFLETGGLDNEYKTYILKQLLTPMIRVEYDKMPLGSIYRDKYVIEKEDKLLSETASKLSGEAGIVVTRDEIVKDILRERAQRKELPALESLNKTWDWGYYLLKTRKKEYEELIRWQEFLTQAHAVRGLVKIISIGYIGNTPEPFVVKTWQGKTIYFLNDEISPSLELAETAVSKIAP